MDRVDDLLCVLENELKDAMENGCHVEDVNRTLTLFDVTLSKFREVNDTLGTYLKQEARREAAEMEDLA
jgi:hypothetical protein